MKHRSYIVTIHINLLGCIVAIAWLVCVCVCLCVCLCVAHFRESSKNGWNGRDAVLVANSGEPKEPRITWGFRSLHVKGHFWGKHCNTELCVRSLNSQTESSRSFPQQYTFVFTRCQRFKTTYFFPKRTGKFASSLQTTVYTRWPFRVTHQPVGSHT